MRLTNQSSKEMEQRRALQIAKESRQVVRMMEKSTQIAQLGTCDTWESSTRGC